MTRLSALNFTVNGRDVTIEADGTAPLLHVLRNVLELRGSKYGCGAEKCGACMVLVDGVPAYSCSREAATVGGRSVTTIEGLSSGGGLHPLQQAFLDEQAGQCGYCLPGILVSAAALLERHPRPSREQIVEALEPHLCRCGIHNRAIRAVERAGAAMAERNT